MPHFVQNFALGRNVLPQDVQLDPPELLAISDGSGDGKVPGSLNPCCADTTEGGAPTGLSDVPVRCGGCIPIPLIVPGEPIPGINPGDCVPPGAAPPAILSMPFFISKITLIAKNSNAE